MRPAVRSFAFRLPLLLWLSLLAGSGCQSSRGNGDNSLASVTITGRTPWDIRFTLTEVFEADGFTLRESTDNSLVFEKKGTTMNDLAHGGWFDGPVWIRVKTGFQESAAGTYRVSANAFYVSDVGDSRFEEEKRVPRVNGGRYQELLDQAQLRLQ